MKLVWLDAGHGGKDPGAAGNGLQEKDIALKLVLGIKRQLESAYQDVKVMLSRSTDVFLELRERTDLANKANADVLVSVHCNAGGGAGGFESYRYTNASAASSALQQALHTAIMQALKPYRVTDRGMMAKNLHMVRESRMPAVLTENLFVDVASDADKLKKPEVIQALVQGHAAGIAKHLGLKPNDAASGGTQEKPDVSAGGLLLKPVNVEVNGKPVMNGLLDSKNGITYVPLRAVAEALQAKVSFDKTTNTAKVEKPE